MVACFYLSLSLSRSLCFLHPTTWRFPSDAERRQVLDGDDWRPKVAALRQLQDQLAAAEGALDAEDSRDVVNFMVGCHLGSATSAHKIDRPY